MEDDANISDLSPIVAESPKKLENPLAQLLKHAKTLRNPTPEMNGGLMIESQTPDA